VFTHFPQSTPTTPSSCPPSWLTRRTTMPNADSLPDR
jgi:hypothetical protein